MTDSAIYACLGWGSLLWSTQGLPVRGAWRDDGPRLPIEFMRISADGRLTLIVERGGAVVGTYRAAVDVASIEEAVEVLARREGCTERNVGRWTPACGGSATVVPEVVPAIGAWAEAVGLAGVVWTDLAPLFRSRTGRSFSAAAAVDYLASLEDPETRARAEEYIRRAPAQTRTAVRALAEERLGWTPLEDES